MKKVMKKTIYSMFIAATMLLASCGGDNTTTSTESVATDYISEEVATAVVPQAATEVIPCAAPGPDAGGKVATEVIPDSTNL
jgi:PBP1b-binding outer membrane lipoprotein LpoB